MEDVLKVNSDLKVLDLTNNRISWEGVKHIIRGLKANKSLQVLKVNVKVKVRCSSSLCYKCTTFPFTMTDVG